VLEHFRKVHFSPSSSESRTKKEERTKTRKPTNNKQLRGGEWPRVMEFPYSSSSDDEDKREEAESSEASSLEEEEEEEEKVEEAKLFVSNCFVCRKATSKYRCPSCQVGLRNLQRLIL
jgi:hypothetical protein